MRIISFIILMLMASCSISQKRDLVSNKKYLSDKEIEREFISLSDQKSIRAENLDEAAKERLKLIIPDKDFVSPDQLKKLRSIKHRKSIKTTQTNRQADRRQCIGGVVSQCGGTCTSHGITNAIDNFLCKPNLQDASNEDLWSSYKQYSTDIGIQAALNNKICEEKDWPNCGSEKSSCSKNRHIKLLESNYIANDIERAKDLLDKGIPLVFSGSITRSWVNCDAVVNPNSSPLSGGHAVALIGYRDSRDVPGGGYFLTLNSWGKNCGDKGVQYIPYNYCQRGDLYCFMHSIEKVASKYLNAPDIPDKKCVYKRTCKRCRACWWRSYCCCSPWKLFCE